MKEIYEMILKEKSKDIPNKEYIQFLQQMSDKSSVDYFIEENKRKQLEEGIYYQNHVDFENFFKYSGKIEELKEGDYKERVKATQIYDEWLKNKKKSNGKN
tara:strand:+ start:149 stop:451 length:303 start_codon:yes stop_codon:yes gene_type:complete